MAKIVKTQEIQINLETIIDTLKTNWNIVVRSLNLRVYKDPLSISVSGPINLASLGKILGLRIGLIAEPHELDEALMQIFREMVQVRHFKNMVLMKGSLSSTGDFLVSFDIPIIPAIMPVDPVDIPGPDNVVNPAY